MKKTFLINHYRSVEHLRSMMLFLKLLFFLLAPLNLFIKTKELLNRTLLSNY